MAGEVEGRIAVITAAASGMGREGSLAFAREGAHVVAIDIDAAAGERLVADIAAAGGSAEFHGVDMTDLAQVAAVARTIGERHGRIDILWNHCGVPGPRGFDFDQAAWERNVALNLTAPVFMTQQCWDLCQKHTTGGSILFTASVSAVIASRNSPVYAALKAGVCGYMRCIAALGGPLGIRSNAILPGATDTPMLNKFFGENESQEVIEQRLASYYTAVPMGRTCRPEEVAELAVFLSGSRCEFITGVSIPIDGGYVAL